MTRAATLGLLLIAAVALALRLPKLDERPLHTDESVHAIKFRGLWEGAGYRYDPHEYHGPSLYYASLVIAWMREAVSAVTAPTPSRPATLDERTLRLVPLVFGLGLILLLPLVRDVLGRGGTLGAGLLTALSPAFVYYSRYYIHELLLVFFTFLLVGAAWRYWKSGAPAWAAVAGAALGLMHATKETFVFVLAALAFAAAATWLWERWFPTSAEEGRNPPHGVTPVVEPVPLTGRLRLRGTEEDAPGGPGPSGTVESRAGRVLPCPGAQQIYRPVLALHPWQSQAQLRFCWRHAAAAAVAALVVSVVLFTSFFTNLQGPLDSLRTYLPWLGRAGGESPHIHPWYFYLHRLGWFHFPQGPVWSELLILGLAVVGWGAALGGQKPSDGCVRFLRFLGFYAFGLLAIYSLIPYKTPWCLLGFHHGFILLAGAALPVLWSWLTTRTLARLWVFVALAIAALQLAVQAWRTAFPYAADRRNPYVYAHTSKDLLRLVDTIRAITRYAPNGDAEMIKVIAPGGDYWPLPWYLRQFTQVGWFAEMPADPYASLMVVSTRFQADLDEKSDKKWLMVGLFEHRPRVFFELYVAFDRWKRYIELRPKPAEED